MAWGPSTRHSLIGRIRSADDVDAWTQFVAIYGPLVRGYARRCGLQEADADDVVQEVFRAVAAAILELEHRPGRGAFRRWLFTITRHRLLDFLKRARRREHGARATNAMALLVDRAAPDQEPEWDQEYERQVFTWAAKRVQPQFQEHTWRAFWRTAVEGRPGPQVAAELGMSLGAVHVARSRVLARLREEVRGLVGDDE